MPDLSRGRFFFAVVDHGIDPGLWNAVFDVADRFFALPVEAKARIDKQNSRHFRGWENVGAELTNNRPDLREQVDIWTERPARSLDVEPPYLRLLGPNQWPSHEVLPGFRTVCEAWMASAGAVADELLRVFGVGLGLGPDHIVERFGDETMSLLKLIRYPPTPDGGAGVNAHHDTGFVTLLAPGETPGLQIQTPGGDWASVPLVPNAFIVNLGEMLQAMDRRLFRGYAPTALSRLASGCPSATFTDRPSIPISTGYRWGALSRTRSPPVLVTRGPGSWPPSPNSKPGSVIWPRTIGHRSMASSCGTTLPKLSG